MPTVLAFTVDDLDAEIQAQNPNLGIRTDYATLRDRAYRRALSEYEDTLFDADDLYARGDTLTSPIALGTEKVNTAVGDIYVVTLPADAARVAGDSMAVSTSTAAFVIVPRIDPASIVIPDTLYGFWENHGKIIVYSKDGSLSATSVASFNYYRNLDATQTPTTTALDVYHRDFGQIVDATTAFMLSYI